MFYGTHKTCPKTEQGDEEKNVLAMYENALKILKDTLRIPILNCY